MALNRFGYRIGEGRKVIPVLFKDVFKSKGEKRALLSYVTKPFYTKSKMQHSNYDECRIAAEIFHELGYSVDVIEQDSPEKIDYDCYDVIYGMGLAFERSFASTTRKDQKRIFYATGCNPNYSNMATILRLREFAKNRRLYLIESSRYIPTSQHCQILLSDKVLVLGNEFVLNTYTSDDPDGAHRYQRLDAFYYDVNPPQAPVNYQQKKKHFLWFGSSGLIHKGLDVLLEYFASQQDLVLHVCGINESEKRFIDVFKNELTESDNVINHGFLRIDSLQFKTLMDTIGFVIFPSVSEGGAVAVLNAIANGGAIPVLTRSTGLDLDAFGFEIETISPKGIADTIEKIRNYTEDELSQMAEHACTNIRSRYTMDRYKVRLKQLIAETIFEQPR